MDNATIGLGSDKDIGFPQKGRKMVSLSNRCVIKCLPTVPVISSISPKLVHRGVPSKYLFESLQNTFLSLIKVLLYSRDLSTLDSVLLDSFYQLELWALFLLFTIQFLNFMNVVCIAILSKKRTAN